MITAGDLILKVLNACAAFSEDAISLGAQFDYDLHVLKNMQNFFQLKIAHSPNNQLVPDDAALLERTTDYLDHLFSRVQHNLRKIDRKGLRGIVNRGLWLKNQAELKEMMEEVFKWTKRFEIRVLGLAPPLWDVLPSAHDVETPPVISSNNKLRNFLAVPSSAKEMRAKELWLDHSDELASEITSWGSASFLPLLNDGKQLIFASRKAPPDALPGQPHFEKLKADMGVLAAALNCLDPGADVRLLKVESYFFHADSEQFLFVQLPPHSTSSMMTLEDAIDSDPFSTAKSTLDQRLKLAVKLAEAVLFLHAAGFVHKNITSSAVVVFQRFDTLSTPTSSHSYIENAFLMGFDLIREVEAKTYKEGFVRKNYEDPRWMWNFGIFQHPDRLEERAIPRYTKTYDIYSLGVLLLEIGLWEPLSAVVREINRDTPGNWKESLLGSLSALGPRTGERYQRIVRWCLTVDGDCIVKEDDFVKLVLDPLESMANSMS